MVQPSTSNSGVEMGKVLIVGNRSLGGSELAELIGERVAAGPCSVHLVVPVPSPVASAVAVGGTAADMAPTLSRDIDQDRRAAQEQLSFGLEWLGGLGATATGELSLDPDTPAVVARLVDAQSFDEVIVSTLPTKVSRWLRQDLPCRIGRKVSVPVTVVSTSTA
jgi:GABA permease